MLDTSHNETRQVLLKGHELVRDALAPALRHALESEEHDDELQKLVERMVWFPVAQVCVSTMLKAILNDKEGDTTIYLAHEDLYAIWKLHTSSTELSLRIGLSEADTEIAMQTTAKVFLESALFAEPKRVRYVGEFFMIAK